MEERCISLCTGKEFRTCTGVGMSPIGLEWDNWRDVWRGHGGWMCQIGKWSDRWGRQRVCLRGWRWHNLCEGRDIFQLVGEDIVENVCSAVEIRVWEMGWMHMRARIVLMSAVGRNWIVASMVWGSWWAMGMVPVMLVGRGRGANSTY